MRAASASTNEGGLGLEAFMLALFPKVIDLYCRVCPSNSAFCYLESMVSGEKFFKSEYHHTLGE